MRGIGKIWIGIFFLLAFSSLRVQAQSLWADVSVNHNSTYLGQPVEVTISVYTSTWFTTGLDLGNIKVEGAFTVYFRPVTTSFSKDGKTFAGVKQIYHVFPYTDKDITFPELDIEVESPAPGDYKGKKHTVKTKPKGIKVKPIPSKFSDSEWLVANGLSVTERWSGDKNSIKVGDVLVRTISRNAAGTISELLPPIVWDSVAHVSFYPSRSEVTNNKTKTAISATRTELMRYLFEEEGEVTLPEMVFTWYNPYRNQLYKRTLKEVKIQVQPNPDLGVLASVRDSLALQQEELAVEEATEDQPLMILGMSPEKFAVVLVVAILLLIILVKLLRRSIHAFQQRRQAYLISEEFHFNEFKKASRSNSQHTIAAKLYRWLDALELDEPNAAFFAKCYGSDALQSQVSTMEARWSSGKQFENMNLSEWASAREKYLHRGVKVDSGWINP
ncbi:Oxygen tolerance [Algoriphagus locisalis]|uniref:Oxygen tolerance n=1 Tax=Algoriphagus locisalis TaxID=305507 RepID=A0A1I7CSA7_9BACT|nr:BatD family protein [Algoriphagus locisalis]SFU02283.1 Oxygen tolerance [Algoriphagus locisalis]